MIWLATKTVSALLLPPLSLLLLGFAGLATLEKRPRLGKGLILASLALLYGLSTPIVGDSALKLIEPARTPVPAAGAGAIVVLGAGTYFSAPEYGSDTVAGQALERLRYAAELHRKTGTPILVSGGHPGGDYAPEAVSMKSVLEYDFHVPVAWTESKSRDTLENARYSFKILDQAGIHTVYLVTSAWHMRRAAMAFRSAGFTVIPAPTAFVTRDRLTILDFLPSTLGLLKSRVFFHEVLGILWYRLQS